MSKFSHHHGGEHGFMEGLIEIRKTDFCKDGSASRITEPENDHSLVAWKRFFGAEQVQ